MGRVIFVTAFKGGVGKTTTSAGIATALSALGKNVCIVDADFGMRCMDLVLGMENSTIYDCSDVLAERCQPEDAIVPVEGREHLWFVPAPMKFDGKKLEKEKVDSFFSLLRERFDYCIVDSSAELSDYYRVFANAADEAIVVTLHQSTAIRAAEKTAANLVSLGFRDVHLVINCYRQKEAESGQLPQIASIIYRSSVPLIGVIPMSEKIPVLQEASQLIFGGKDVRLMYPFEVAYLNIACRVCGIQISLLQGVGRPGFKKKMLKVAADRVAKGATD